MEGGVPKEIPIVLSGVISLLKAAKKISSRVDLGALQNAQMPFFLKNFVADLAAMNVGEKILVPNSLKNGGPFCILVEKERSGLLEGGVFRLVLFQTDAEGALKWHPRKVTKDKILFQTGLVFKDIPEKKIVDDVFWAFLFKVEQSGEAVLYDTLLPYLIDAPLEEGLEGMDAINEYKSEGYAPGFKTPQVSGIAHYRCITEAIYYVLRRKKLSATEAKAVSFALRSQMCRFILNDLSFTRAIENGSRHVITISNKQMAYAAVKLSESGIITPPALAEVQSIIFDIDKKVSSLPCPDRQSTDAPPFLDLDDEAMSGYDEASYPHMDRLLRLDDVSGLAGQAIIQPPYSPVDLLQVPIRVTNFSEAVAALRAADEELYLLEHQEHCVKNIAFLKAALLEQLFAHVIPVPKPPQDESHCLWRLELLRAQQLDTVIILHRLMEHFVAAVSSLQATKPFDAVRIIIPSVIAAVTDAVLRATVTDMVSPFSESLRSGFGLSSGHLGAQSETIEVTTPELNVARTGVLDYFKGLLELPGFRCFMSWEDGAAIEKNTIIFMMMLAKKGALTPSLSAEYPIGSPYGLEGAVLKQYPEALCYRDIAFYFKYMMNIDPRAFITLSAGSPTFPSYWAKLSWSLKEGKYEVGVDVGSGQMREIYCEPRFPFSWGSGHRWGSFAAPGTLTSPKPVETEDDVLHVSSLPDFEGALNEQDTELLISYLTAPYIRIPLVLTFFATEDRIHSLRNERLQKVLDSVLFEPGRFLPSGLHEAPTMVPSEKKELLATPYGLIVNELQRSPTVFLRSVLELVRLGLDLDTGSAKSSTIDVILHVVRTGARVENYLSFLVEHSRGHHEA